MKQLQIPNIGRQTFSLSAWLRENDIIVTKNPQDGHAESASWVAMIEISGDIHTAFSRTKNDYISRRVDNRNSVVLLVPYVRIEPIFFLPPISTRMCIAPFIEPFYTF